MSFSEGIEMQSLTIFAKSLIVDAWQGTEYAYD